MRIIGTGRAHPSKIVTNAMLEQFLDTNDEWIKTRTGIAERRVISSEKLEDLATEAALKAIADAGLTPKDIDYIICSNVVNEYITPGLSCIVQGAIGAKCLRGYKRSMFGICLCFGYGRRQNQEWQGSKHLGDSCRGAISHGGLERPQFVRIVRRWSRCGGGESWRGHDMLASNDREQDRLPVLCAGFGANALHHQAGVRCANVYEW